MMKKTELEMMEWMCWLHEEVRLFVNGWHVEWVVSVQVVLGLEITTIYQMTYRAGCILEVDGGCLGSLKSTRTKTWLVQNVLW